LTDEVINSGAGAVLQKLGGHSLSAGSAVLNMRDPGAVRGNEASMVDVPWQ
jgi:hypothetical protein